MSYTFVTLLTSSSPNIWIFTSTDNISTITSSNYIGSDWSGSLIEGDLMLMQYPTNQLGYFIIHFNSGNLFLIPNGSMTTDGTSGGNFVTSSNIETITKYNGTTLEIDPITWTGTSTTTSGVATFHPTLDGTSTGTAIFTNITSVSALASNNTTSPIAYPFSSLKQIVSGNKTITINVGNGANILGLGLNSISNAPDGTTVYLTVVGN